MMTYLNLAESQSPDGGWSFRGRESCTEATALAALALFATNGPRGSYERALAWLRKVQRSDGGWPPMVSVAQSTWVTSLVLLLPPLHIGEDRYARGVEWLLRLEGHETTFLHRIGQQLRGVESAEGNVPGWPWYPGAAAWTGPTATALLALRRVPLTARIGARIAAGQRFLLDRRCTDGGWNHGSIRALGVEADSYPETTGLALTALKGLPAGVLDKSIACARRQLASCRSTEAANWLQLGLRSHGVTGLPVSFHRCHDPRDRALQMLATAPAERNPFL